MTDVLSEPERALLAALTRAATDAPRAKAALEAARRCRSLGADHVEIAEAMGITPSLLRTLLDGGDGSETWKP